jgi:hypothetical protein
MRAELIESFARSTLHLTMEYRNPEFEGTVKSWIGTGIIRKLNGKSYLITALHNLSGRHPDGKPKDEEHGCLPNYLKVQGYCTTFERRLYEGENNPSADTALYWEHPAGRTYDVGVLPLESVHVENVATVHETFFAANSNPFKDLYPTQLCFVVGFPEGLVDYTEPHFPRPIFKSAHIAFDPRIDFNGEPVLLLDALTRPGQSGSPVFATETAWNSGSVPNCFIGIYSGRYTVAGKDLAGLNIGRVFKPRVINEIFEAHGLRSSFAPVPRSVR